MTSGHSKTLPNPPIYLRSALHVPPFFAYNHPYTKWMLNMIRGNANHRLNIMVKERPELFQQYYQIADQPYTVSSINQDALPLFHERCVLYLTPLALAIYMKREKAAEMLLKAGINHPQQSCYATEVFSRGARCADILEVFVACVALRREFFDAIPLLCYAGQSTDADDQPERITLKIHEPICLRYENRDGHRQFRYKDLLHYATETTLRRPNFPLCRLLELLIGVCNDFVFIDKIQFSGNTRDPVSVFRRLARYAFYQDPDLRMCLQLISSLMSLLKNRTCVWPPLSELHCHNDPEFTLRRIKSRTDIDLDHDASMLLLCGLYQRIREKTKNGSLDHMAQLIYYFLSSTRWRTFYLNVEPDRIQPLFQQVRETVKVSNNTLVTIQKHIEVIVASENDREMAVSSDFRLRREKGKTFRSTCCLMRDMSPQRFLQPTCAVPQPKRNPSGMVRKVEEQAPMDLAHINDQDYSVSAEGTRLCRPETMGSLFSYHPEQADSMTPEMTPSSDMSGNRLASSPEAFGHRGMCGYDAMGYQSAPIYDSAHRQAAYPDGLVYRSASEHEALAHRPIGHQEALGHLHATNPEAFNYLSPSRPDLMPNRQVANPEGLNHGPTTNSELLGDRQLTYPHGLGNRPISNPVEPHEAINRESYTRPSSSPDRRTTRQQTNQQTPPRYQPSVYRSSDRHRSSVSSLLASPATRLSCLPDSDKTSTGRNGSDSGSERRTAAPAVGKTGDEPEDDLAHLDSDWRDLEITCSGDASLLDFLQAEPAWADSVGSRRPPANSHRPSVAEDKRSRRRTRSCGLDVRSLFKNSSNAAPSADESTVFDDSVARIDIDAYEDCVLHEMLEDFTGEANVSTQSTVSMPIYGRRKYNHNQRPDKA